MAYCGRICPAMLERIYDMRIERVEGNRKIRVMLSQSDLVDMNINIRTLTPDSPQLHSFLFRIMDYVKRETGFNAKSGQVIVEASPSEGGVILTVTKIEQPKSAIRRNIKSVRAKKKVYPKCVYRFFNFDALCGYLGSSGVCAGDMKIFELEKDYFAVTASGDRRLSEFAERIGVPNAKEHFLREHGNLIAEGETLENMIKGIKNLQ